MSYIVLFIFGIFAWFFSTLFAGGAATMLIPIVSLILGASLVAPVISIAALIANPSRVFIFRKDIDWQVAGYLLPGSIVGAILGAWSLTKFDPSIIQLIIGFFLITYVLQDQFSRTKLSIKMRLSWFFPLGFVVSSLSGLIGATGPVHNPFMLSYGLVKERLIATKSVNSLIMQLTKIVSYGSFGLLSIEIGLYGLSLGAGAVIGVFLAKNHLQKLAVQQFRQYVMLFMFISGITLIIKVL